MFDGDDGAQGRREAEATARGERIRAELMERLRTGGPQSATDLDPQTPSDVSASEVAFQLERLADEGQITGEVGGVYRIAGERSAPRGGSAP